MTSSQHWPARDGYPLSGTVNEPESAATSSVLIAGASAVPARFYRRFARYLAVRGMRAVTFDYRGIDTSLHGGIRSVQTGMRDWAEKDLAAVIDHVSNRFPDTPLAVIGHSAGGQFVALADNSRRIDALMLVAAQSGYWRHWPPRHRYLLAALWYGVMPGMAGLLGYFPARRLGLGENLPAGVAKEWARWCRHPAYFVEADGEPIKLNLDRFTGPVISYSIDDDWMAPRAAVDALYEHFSGAKRERRHVRPGDCGVDALGHFGFFRDPGRQALWPAALAWIASATAQAD